MVLTGGMTHGDGDSDAMPDGVGTLGAIRGEDMDSTGALPLIPKTIFMDGIRIATIVEATTVNLKTSGVPETWVLSKGHQRMETGWLMIAIRPTPGPMIDRHLQHALQGLSIRDPIGTILK